MSSDTLWDKFFELGCDLSASTPGDVNWMSDDPLLKPFICWFQDYISAENVLNPGEIEEYNQLCQAGEELHGKELDEALQRANIHVDDLEIEDHDLLEEQDEISFLKGQIEALSRVEEILQASLKNHQESELALQKNLCEEQKACFKDGQVLMKLSAGIKAGLEDFFLCLQKLASTCLNYKNAETHHFLAQGPLEDYISQCISFEEHVKVFIERQFKQKGLPGKSTSEKLLLAISDYPDEKEYSANIVNTDTIQGILKIHPKTLWEAEVRRVCALAKLKGLQAVTKHLQSLRANVNEGKDLSALRLLNLRCEEDCSVLECQIDSLRQNELSISARDFVVATIASIAEDFARAKNARRRYRLSKLQILQDALSRHVLLTDVVWLLLRREKKLVNVAAQFIDETATFLIDEHAKHLAVMELHQGIQEKHEDFQKSAAKGQIPLVASLCRLMRIDQTDDITPLVTAIQDLSNRVAEVDQKSFMGDVLDTNFAMEKSLKALERGLFAGPTKQPILIPADIIRAIGSVENSVVELEDTVKRLERQFSSKQELFKKFPIQRGSQLLWAWFLAAPAQLSAALKRAEQAVGKQ